MRITLDRETPSACANRGILLTTGLAKRRVNRRRIRDLNISKISCFNLNRLITVVEATDYCGGG
jgi:hypothetical protein